MRPSRAPPLVFLARGVLARGVLAAGVLAGGIGATAARAEDAGPKPLFSYVGAFNGVAAGGLSKTATYVHALAAGVQAPVGGPWSVTLQGAWTTGSNLSARAIGDVAGVQGPFNSGDGLWLYELKATYATDAATVQLGRVSTGDALPGVAGMSQFVNSAYSSNGGAITVNDPGRAATPASTWGAWGRIQAGLVELRGGAFLSDPNRTTLRRHGTDFSFRPADGVLGFGEAVAPVGAGLRIGMGAYGDSARFQAFDGREVRGNGGWYLWLERPAPDKPAPAFSGFAMVEGATRDDRSLQPLFLIAGLTWQGIDPRRPADALSVGFTIGGFSHASLLRGRETTLEANYRVSLTDHLTARPDVQYVISPGGRGGGPDALVLGVQIEASL
ncbi:carbohydrate porin [Phenylobacterium sp.]|uniref:carbohydrate porin n=1 Tax=Phenylobacterium sp. TaxID=1871053 RepID=UPI00286B872F|nr:carbohydrate porin [Phenylobacterium sp.]